MPRVIEINEIGELLELRDEWNKVLERSRDKNVYLTWEYLSTFWKHFGNGKKLKILCLEDENKIISIAPLRQLCYAFLRPMGYHVIEPLGYRGLMPEGADYTGFILAKKEEESLQSFLNYLARNGDWDFIYLFDVPGTSRIPALLAKVTKAIPLEFDFEKGVSCPYMSVPSSIDAFLAGLSARQRYNIRKSVRKLNRDFSRVAFTGYDEFHSVEEAMNVFFELHQKRWKLRRMPGAFDKPEVRDFYRDVAKLFAKRGWLSLDFLKVDDQPIAGMYSFEYNQKMYGALSGFDPDFSQYSVGNVLFTKVVEKCIKRKIKEFDFMKGDESYKSKYSTGCRRNLGIRFVNKRLISKLYHVAIRTMKRLKMDQILRVNALA